MMRCAISHAHLPSRSQQLEMMRTPRNRPTVGRHERFRYQVPLTVTASSHSLQSVLFQGKEISNFLAGYERVSGWNRSRSRKTLN